MNGMLVIFKHELRAYFATPLAYIFLLIFLVLSGFQTFRDDGFLNGQASLLPFFQQLPLLLLLLVPAMAMRLWAEERKSNTLELLLTLPLTTRQIVIGKFLSAWAMLAVALCLTFPLVLTVQYLGEPDPGQIFCGYLSAWLLAGAFLAMGSFFSSLTRNQAIAFVMSVITIGAFYYAGTPAVLKWITMTLNAPTAEIYAMFSLQTRFEQLQRGVIDAHNLVFFWLMIFGWLWGNILIIDHRR